ncbi:MAG: hypothetical protein L0Z70_03035 [Chloroflexi bacterium]|nr:hypothetical protein [Chloroflexota bacterium]
MTQPLAPPAEWNDLPAAAQPSPPRQNAAPAPRCGDLCPHCRAERLDYDSLLNLVCPRCGSQGGGCFT